MSQVIEERPVGYLKIVLPKDDHERLRTAARRLGVSMSAYLRMVALRSIERDEASRRQNTN